MIKFNWKNLVKSGSFWFTAVAVFLTLAGIGFAFCQWDWLHDSEPETSVSTTLRNIGLLIGGVIALVFAIWRGIVSERQADASQRQAKTAERQAETALHQTETALHQTETAQRQVEIAQQGLLNERYQKGAEMLGSDILAVRLAGIYALQRLAEEHAEQYHIQIMQLFCAFVRNPTGEAEGPMYYYADMEEPIRRLREDVQAIMSAIGSRSETAIAMEKATENFELNLRNADLRGIQLDDGDLSGAFFWHADLSDAVLEGLELHEIILVGANLSSAFLGTANLSNAGLGHADLSDIYLSNVNLSGADLAGANLSNAEITSTYLSRAILYDANLTGASFSVLTVTGSYGAQSKGLTQAQLDEARSDPENPPNLDGVLDAETGEQLVWRGQPIDDDPQS